MNRHFEHLARNLLALAAIAVSTFTSGCAPSTVNGSPGTSRDPVKLLNVSYDPTREFYEDFNRAFAEHWLAEKGQEVTIEQSHGGSGKQARAVIEGLPADVVTLALGHDIEAIASQSQLLAEDWQSRLPSGSAPYTSTIVFLVRKGNPRSIHDWSDLLQDNLQIITPNPKTSGGARWNYLAAWGYALQRELGDLAKLHDPTAASEVRAAQGKARAYVGKLIARVPVWDSGARGATNTFVQREIGDVLLTWENEAFLTVHEFGPDKFEIVSPSVSILAEPPVAVVDKNVDKHGTRAVAEAYLQYLYSPAGQALAARHYFRPSEPQLVPAETLRAFSNLKLFTVGEVFGSWAKAQSEHFDDGGVFDQLNVPAN